jgi:signal transduction protein with GAF and PtsI domain
VETTDRHLRLLTETIAAVNSTLDLEEVLHLVANEVAAALEADACFVYLYDDAAGELILRATHGTPLDEMTSRPRMRPGEGITGTAAAELRPVAIAANAAISFLWSTAAACWVHPSLASGMNRASLLRGINGPGTKVVRRT